MQKQADLRYQSLDGVRGLAALMVMFCHGFGHSQTLLDHAWRWKLHGDHGLFIFFTVSGYCILAAIESSPQQSFPTYFIRRCLRIFPPFWASIAFSVALMLLTVMTGQRQIPWLDTFPSASQWLHILTLTHTNLGIGDPYNGVSWTLCYELQFYIALGVMLYMPRRLWSWYLFLLTVLSVLVRAVPAVRSVSPMFLYHFPEFALGCAVCIWLSGQYSRWLTVAIMLAVAVIPCFEFQETWRLAALHEKSDRYGLLTSMVTALALIVLCNYDSALAKLKVMRLLIFVGSFSYSLYLIHFPLMNRVQKLFARFVDIDHHLGWALVSFITAMAIALVTAWLFSLVIEVPSIRWSRQYGKKR
ncbi:MAG: acyltransferase [Gemmatales bacterium]